MTTSSTNQTQCRINYAIKRTALRVLSSDEPVSKGRAGSKAKDLPLSPRCGGAMSNASGRDEAAHCVSVDLDEFHRRVAPSAAAGGVMEKRVEVFPRRKAGESASTPARDRSPVHLNYSEMAALFHTPQREAARRLGISLTSLKKVSRKLGILRWPYTAATDSGTKRTRVRPEDNASSMAWGLSAEQRRAEKRRKTQERNEMKREKRCTTQERREKERRRTQDAEGQGQGTRERAREHATIGLLLAALSTPSNQEGEQGAALRERAQVPFDERPAGSRHNAEEKRQHNSEDEIMQARQLPSVVTEGLKARSRLLNAAHILSQVAPRSSTAANVVKKRSRHDCRMCGVLKIKCRGKCQPQPCPAERANLAAKLAARWPHESKNARTLQRKR